MLQSEYFKSLSTKELVNLLRGADRGIDLCKYPAFEGQKFSRYDDSWGE